MKWVCQWEHGTLRNTSWEKDFESCCRFLYKAMKGSKINHNDQFFVDYSWVVVSTDQWKKDRNWSSSIEIWKMSNVSFIGYSHLLVDFCVLHGQHRRVTVQRAVSISLSMRAWRERKKHLRKLPSWYCHWTNLSTLICFVFNLW